MKTIPMLLVNLLFALVSAYSLTTARTALKAGIVLGRGGSGGLKKGEQTLGYWLSTVFFALIGLFFLFGGLCGFITTIIR